MFKLSRDPAFAAMARDIWIRPAARWFSAWTRRRRSRR
jgi:hypothetical protein